MLTRPRRSVGALLYPFVLGLVFAATAAIAHRAGTAWSPKPDWATPATPSVAVGTTQPPAAQFAAGCSRVTASGLQYAVLASSGSRIRAQRDDTVKVRFDGWSADGTQITGLPRDGVARFRVDQLIPGWVEGLQLMAVGDRMRLCIPESLAYMGRTGVPAGVLTFEIELLAIDPT